MELKLFIADTNALSAFAFDEQLIERKKLNEDSVFAISVISKIEIGLLPVNASEKKKIDNLQAKLDVVDLSSDNLSLIQETIRIRKKYKLKLPDAVIAATAVTMKATLITADRSFENVFFN